MSWMASKTIEFGAIDQTAEPLCAKIEPTEPAISIDFSNYAPLYEKIQKRNFAHATWWSSQRDRGASRRDWRAGVRRSRAHPGRIPGAAEACGLQARQEPPDSSAHGAD